MGDFVEVVSELSRKNDYDYESEKAVEPLVKSCQDIVLQCYVGDKPDAKRKKEGALIQEKYCRMKNFSDLPSVLRGTWNVW